MSYIACFLNYNLTFLMFFFGLNRGGENDALCIYMF